MHEDNKIYQDWLREQRQRIGDIHQKELDRRKRNLKKAGAMFIDGKFIRHEQSRPRPKPKRKQITIGKTIITPRSGFTVAELRAKYDRSDGCCYICGERDTWRNKPLVFSRVAKQYICRECCAALKKADLAHLQILRQRIDKFIQILLDKA